MEPRAPDVGRCRAHCRRCQDCNSPISRGKWCQTCKTCKEELKKQCARPNCTAPHMPRQPNCFNHTLTCGTCKQPMKRGKPCPVCARNDDPQYYHEALARRVIEHAFWPNKAPPCKCSNNKKKCKKCMAIETRRLYYTYKERSRWFDFDIVLKVPVRQPDGSIEWVIKVVVEIDGPSHHKAIKVNGAKSNIVDQKLRDKLKKRCCRREKIHLVRINCYFGNPKKKMWPDPPKFLKLVHAEIWGIHEAITSGYLGSEASALLRQHWRDDWYRHPDAKL